MTSDESSDGTRGPKPDLECDQAHMSERLQALERGLIDAAYVWFRTERDETWDHGRFVAAVSLAVVIDFLEDLGTFKEDGLAEPLVQLLAALLQLEQGHQHPMLVAKHGHRAPDHLLTATLKGRAAAAAELWHNAGLELPAAAEIVAEALTKAGCRLRSGRADKFVTGATVLGWREGARGRDKNPGRKRDAYLIALKMTEDLDLSGEDSARRVAESVQLLVHERELYKI